MLAFAHPNLRYSVDWDAWTYGIGCSLFQTHQNGQRKPIGFWSHSQNIAEKNYFASECEFLLVVWPLKTVRPYLKYETFIVHTERAALHWLLTIDDSSGRLMRWWLRLAKFNFQVKYKKGSSNQQADDLFRLHTNAETFYHDNNDAIPTSILTDTLYNNSEQRYFVNIA